jgi:hypothetical protein
LSTLLICVLASVKPFTGIAADAWPTTMLEPSKARAKKAILRLAIATPPVLRLSFAQSPPSQSSHIRDVRKLKALLANVNLAKTERARIPPNGCRNTATVVTPRLFHHSRLPSALCPANPQKRAIVTHFAGMIRPALRC